MNDDKPEKIEFSFSIALPMASRERPIDFYALVIICCAYAGTNWIQRPHLGATINLILAAIVCALHDRYAGHIWSEKRRRKTIENARREFGVTIPESATIADATAIVGSTMLLRLPRQAPHAQA